MVHLSDEQEQTLSQGIDEGNGHQHYTYDQIGIIDKFVDSHEHSSSDVDLLIEKDLITPLELHGKQGSEAFKEFCIKHIIQILKDACNSLDNCGDFAEKIAKLEGRIRTRPDATVNKICKEIIHDYNRGAFSDGVLTDETPQELSAKYDNLSNIVEGGKKRKRTSKRASKRASKKTSKRSSKKTSKRSRKRTSKRSSKRTSKRASKR